MAVPTAYDVARYTLTAMRDFGVDSLVFTADLPSSQPRELRSEDLDSRKREISLLEELLKELKTDLQDAI